jgi:hypothetical protein
MGAISIRGMTQQNGRSKQISFPWPGGTRGIGGTQADMATLGQQLAAHPHRPPTARHTLEKGVVIFAECTCRSKRNLRARFRSALPGRRGPCLACSRYDAGTAGRGKVERSQEAVKGPYRRTK